MRTPRQQFWHVWYWRRRKRQRLLRARKVAQFEAAGVPPVGLDEWKRSFMLRSADPDVKYISYPATTMTDWLSAEESDRLHGFPPGASLMD